MGRKATYYGDEVPHRPGTIACALCGEEVKRTSAATHRKSQSCKWEHEKRAMKNKGWVRCQYMRVLRPYWPEQPVVEAEMAVAWWSRGGWGKPGHVSREWHVPCEAQWIADSLSVLPGTSPADYNEAAKARLKVWTHRLFGDLDAFNLAVFVFRSLHENQIRAANDHRYPVSVAYPQEWAERVADALDLPAMPTASEAVQEDRRAWLDHQEMINDARRKRELERERELEQEQRAAERQARWLKNLDELVNAAREQINRVGGERLAKSLIAFHDVP